MAREEGGILLQNHRNLGDKVGNFYALFFTKKFINLLNHTRTTEH